MNEMIKTIIIIIIILSTASYVCAEESVSTEPSSLRLGYTGQKLTNIPRGFISKENGKNCELTYEPIIRTQKYGFDNLNNDKNQSGFPEYLIRSYAFIPIPTVFTSHVRLINEGK